MLFKQSATQRILHEDTYRWIKEDGSNYDLFIVDPLFNDTKLDKEFLTNLDRLSNPSAQLVFFIDWPNLNRFQNLLNDHLLKELGWTQLNHIVWSRMSPGTKKSHYKTGYEFILWYAKDPKNYTFNAQFRKITGPHVLPYKNKDGSPRGWFYDETTGERTRWAETGNVWMYTRPSWSSEEFSQHGMQKPLQLSDRIILTATNENDSILDTFSGSGSFGVSAKRLNRNYTGLEIEEKWVNLIKERLNSAFDLKH